MAEARGLFWALVASGLEPAQKAVVLHTFGVPAEDCPEDLGFVGFGAVGLGVYGLWGWRA